MPDLSRARATYVAPGISIALTPTPDESALLSRDGGRTIVMFGLVFERVAA